MAFAKTARQFRFAGREQPALFLLRQPLGFLIGTAIRTEAVRPGLSLADHPQPDVLTRQIYAPQFAPIVIMAQTRNGDLTPKGQTPQDLPRGLTAWLAYFGGIDLGNANAVRPRRPGGLDM